MFPYHYVNLQLNIMVVRITKINLTLYLLIVLVYLFVWVHTDLARYPGQVARSIANNLWQAAYVVILNIIYFDYILQLAVSKKSYRAVVIVLTLVFYSVLFGVGLYIWRLIGLATGLYAPFQSPTSVKGKIDAIILFTPGAFLIFAAFRLFFEYVRLKHEGEQVRLERKQAELLFLQSQINPHFLFNTLNNIYSLSQHKPELVSVSILRLAKLLRYMLYETTDEFVTVDKEVKVVQDYLDLEKLRYKEDVPIEFFHSIDDHKEAIPPFLFIPLIENAFKHGVSKFKGNRFVRISLTVHKKNLKLVVENSANKDAEIEDEREGIGLTNLYRRLTLLYREFDLIDEYKNLMYTSILNINLNSNVRDQMYNNRR